jgi:microcystin-dependent protein
LAKLSEMSAYLCRFGGKDAIGARARFYDAGGNTPKTVYQDGNLNSAFPPNGILSDANAQLPDIWISGTTAYRCVVTTAGGAVIRDRDYIPGETAAGGGGGGGGGTDLTTGDIIAAYATGTRTGFVRLNARTIGSAASGASELASADAEDLFLHLWTVDTTLAVSGGRGASAAADWAANKQLTLPNGRDKALVGLDDMGNTAAGGFAGVTFTSGNATTLGSIAGSATVALTTAQLAAHTHTGTTDNAGSHAHSGTTASDGSHTHTGSANAAGSHNHGSSTGAGGVHTHTGSTTAVNDHQHAYSDGGSSGNNTVALGGGATVPSVGDSARVTSGAGAHNHTLVVDAVGDHTHSIPTQGDHTHTLTIASGGAHTHTYTTDTFAAHQHAFTTASSGSGAAHLNMQPSLLVTLYIKL